VRGSSHVSKALCCAFFTLELALRAFAMAAPLSTVRARRDRMLMIVRQPPPIAHSYGAAASLTPSLHPCDWLRYRNTFDLVAIVACVLTSSHQQIQIT
jgi:hypothetical protein